MKPTIRTSKRRSCRRAGIGFLAVCSLILTPGMMTVRARAGDRAFPRPAAVWPSGPLDLIVAFPESITPGMASSLVGRTISCTEPGTRTNHAASPTSPAGTLRIAGARLADCGRTLLLATDPHPRPARYRLHLGPDSGGFNCDYDLSGVEVAWSRVGQEGDVESEPDWKGWWPELDLDASRRLSRGSALHERGLKRLEEPGRLVVAAQVVLPPGEVQVRIESTSPVSEAMLGDDQPAEPDEEARGSGGRAVFTLRSRGEPLFLTFTVETGPKSRLSALRVVYRAGNEGAFRAIERDRLSLPWAPLAHGPAPGTGPATTVPPDLDGGDPRRGAEVFFGDRAKCAQCHAFGGRGGDVGPDLTQIGKKGRAHVYQSIAAPSAEIAPDYVPYTVAARDGRVLAGLVRADGPDAIRVTDTNARTTTLRRDEIDQVRPSGTSIMPVGLAAAIGPAGLRDLMALLMSGAERKAPAVR